MKLCKLTITALALTPLFGLGGCSTELAEIDDYYRPAMHYERYPIEVAKGAVRLDVSTKKSRLTARQEDSVTRFGQQAIAAGASRIEVKRPSSGASGSVAERVTELLVASGVPTEAIAQTDYSAGRGAPVIVTFDRKFAVTAECGDWSEDIAITGQNTKPPNYGCATQHNIAAIVANPEDFETPRTATPADPMRRYQVFVDYRKPKNNATSISSSETQTVSDVAQQ
jgi:pilus assembly protein CpaD